MSLHRRFVLPYRAPARALASLILLGLAACGGGGGGGGVPAVPPEFQLDPMFGSGGEVTGMGTGSQTDYRRAHVVSSGAMAIVGTTGGSGGTFGTLHIERRLADGSPDTGFSGDGQTQFGPSSFDPKGIFLNESDGSILVAADRGVTGYSILKVLPIGTLEPTFGTLGVVSVTTPSFVKLAGMVVDATGRIVVAGWTNGVSFIMRYLTNGAPDPAWNGGVQYTFQIFGDDTLIKALGRRSGGGYFVAGNTQDPPNDAKLVVGAFGTNGLPVPGFGSAGFLIYTPPFTTNVTGLVTRIGGAAFVYGTKSPNTAFALGVTSTGGIDPVFGYVESSTPASTGSLGATTSASDAGLTLGYRDQANQSFLWSILATGQPDPNFGVSGVSAVPTPSGALMSRIEPHPLGGFVLLGIRGLAPGTEGVLLRLVDP